MTHLNPTRTKENLEISKTRTGVNAKHMRRQRERPLSCGQLHDVSATQGPQSAIPCWSQQTIDAVVLVHGSSVGCQGRSRNEEKNTETNCWNVATVFLGLNQSSHAKGETQSVTAGLSTITWVLSMTVSSSYLSHVDEQYSNPLVSSFHPLSHSAGFALGLLLQSGRKSNIRIEQINGHVFARCATYDSFNSFASITLRSNSFRIADRSLCQAN